MRALLDDGKLPGVVQAAPHFLELSCEENADPPRLVIDRDTPADAEPIALATGPDGQLALLTWAADGEACVQRLTRDGWEAPLALLTGHFPFSVAWVSPDRVAVLAAGLSEALVFALGTQDARLVGDRQRTWRTPARAPWHRR